MLGWLQTVMFCFAAVQALTAALSAALGCAMPRLQSLACQLWGCGIMDYATLAACLPATGIVVVWFIGRHTMWAWPLQDAMGVSLIVLLLRQFRLPDIKVHSLSDHDHMSGMQDMHWEVSALHTVRLSRW